MENVISRYSDQNAVEDGILVAIGPKDRVTRTVWEYLAEKAPSGSKPPNCWPVEMMGWFQAEKISRQDAHNLLTEYGAERGQEKLNQIIADRKALALSKGLIGEHSRAAVRVYEENTDGGIYKLYPHIGEDGKFSELAVTTLTNGEGKPINDVLWLLPNECGGVTLMFPEDY